MAEQNPPDDLTAFMTPGPAWFWFSCDLCKVPVMRQGQPPEETRDLCGSCFAENPDHRSGVGRMMITSVSWGDDG